ncbi:unnamed protein product [Spirodela intermedia]|uniref:GRAM domain-containing protein n=1 Tax=Spirodela intermedia TaxID=51605 RepID=A0A7I8JGE6_SPIIN|nr:unnamed protein product [Spirodela intermedia]CAA6668825.1 unnamed protein product [Spirodela intermedia]
MGTPIPQQPTRSRPLLHPVGSRPHESPLRCRPFREAYPFAPTSGPPAATAAQGVNPYVHRGAHEANPYVQTAPASHSSATASMETVVKVLGRCGKKLEKGAKNAGTAADHLWQHRIRRRGARQALRADIWDPPGEKLRKAYACYLSTPSGPAIGTLYLSTRRLAFCSDHGPPPLGGSRHQPTTRYAVVLELSQVLAVVPSPNRMNPSDKYIQVLTTAGHELWFMGFVSYDKAVKNLTEALQKCPPATAW